MTDKEVESGGLTLAVTVGAHDREDFEEPREAGQSVPRVQEEFAREFVMQNAYVSPDIKDAERRARSGFFFRMR